jgi:hypothetical protein
MSLLSVEFNTPRAQSVQPVNVVKSIYFPAPAVRPLMM